VELTTILGILGGALSMIAYAPYWHSIFRGTTRPQRASWLIWIFSNTLILATSFALGARDSLWVPVAYVIGTIITFAISIKRGEGGTHWFDVVCLVVTGISIILWYMTGDALQSLIINLSIVAIGTIPTVIKITKDPHSENLNGFSFWFLGSVCSLLAVLLGKSVTIDLWIQPVSFLVLQAIVVSIMVVFRYRKLIGKL